MRILSTSVLQIVFCLSFSAAVSADGPDDQQKVSDRVQKLEAELTLAKQETARLEAELAAAKQELARLDSTPGLTNHQQAVAMTRLDDNELQDGAIRSISRIAPLVPGMLYSQTGIEARFAMRGAYTNRTGPEAEPILGIFEDGVPVTTTTDALGPYVDIERIDVLRGPQGVQYGRNAFGGVIDVRSNKPDPAGWDTALEGMIGSSDLTRFEAMLNIPVLETLAIRLAGASESYQGFVNNYVLEESDADDLKTRMQQYVRMSIRWQPSPDFGMQLNFASLDQNGTGSGIWGYQQIGAMIDGEYQPGHHFAPPGASPDFGPKDVARNMASLAELENLSTTLRLDWDLGFATLQWLVNKSKFESLQAYDSDYSNGGSAYDSDFNGWNSFMDTWFSDLRLASTGQGGLDWFAGLYWLDRETDWGWLETVNSHLLQPSWDVDGLFVTESVAAYAGVGYRLGERTRVFGGLRWYEDQKTSRHGDQDSWDGVLWNAGLEYAFSDTTDAYVKASTGYRPGGLNEVSGVPLSFDPESVTAYEIGVKTLLADATMTLSLAAFLNDYGDMQAQSFTTVDLPGTAGLMDYMMSAGGKESMGLEATFEWSPDAHWLIAAQLAWLDAEFDSYTVPGLDGLDDDPGYDAAEALRLDGWQPAFSPEWMLGLQASYLFDLGRWGGIRPVLHANFVSDYYTNDLNLPGALQPAHNIADLRLFWYLPGDKLRLQLYIENFSDEQVLNSTMIYNPEERPEIATFLADWGGPTRYGLTLSYRY